MAESIGQKKGGGVTEGVRAMRQDLSSRNLNQVAEQRLEDQPMLRHLLAWNVVLPAALFALVLGTLFFVVISPPIGAVVLILAFGGAWYGLAHLDHDKRRRTSPAEGGEKEAEPDEE